MSLGCERRKLVLAKQIRASLQFREVFVDGPIAGRHIRHQQRLGR